MDLGTATELLWLRKQWLSSVAEFIQLESDSKASVVSTGYSGLTKVTSM